jgi:hypothetical protein
MPEMFRFASSLTRGILSIMNSFINTDAPTVTGDLGGEVLRSRVCG